MLLYVGRITEIKQPLLLIDLFKTISSIKPNIHLIIVRSGNLFVKMRKKKLFATLTYTYWDMFRTKKYGHF